MSQSKLAKAILLGAALSITASGCSTVEFVENYQGFSHTFETTAADPYGAAVQCALENLTVPSANQFFSYENAERKTYTLTYHYKLMSSSGLSVHDARSTLSAKVEDQQITFKFTNPQWFYAEAYNGPRWTAVASVGMVASTEAQQLAFSQQMQQCINQQ